MRNDFPGENSNTRRAGIVKQWNMTGTNSAASAAHGNTMVHCRLPIPRGRNSRQLQQRFSCGTMPFQNLLPAFLVLAMALSTGAASMHSKLWGKNGEAWSPASRLPDWSFAGFGRGESEPPRVPVAANVRDFGARGDGVHDDTEAFRRAIETVKAGAIEIPAGRYVITGIIRIGKSGVVLRGAGEGETVLFFPKTLTDVRPDWGTTTGGRRTSNYSWSGGFIQVTGSSQGRMLGRIVRPATRGTTALWPESTNGISPGMEIILTLADDENHRLTHYVYADDPGPIENIGENIRPTQVFRVREVRDGRILLDRPLRFDIRPEWSPVLHAFEPSVTGVGIEHLTFEFPDNPYLGHFTELGHNGIALSDVAHCWVRHVRFVNAESGIFLSGRFSTIQSVVLNSKREPDRQGNRGHHGLTVVGEDNLVTDFTFNVRYIHDLTVSRGSIGNVFSNGRGVDMNFDHHRRGPYENLFTDIDVGEGRRVWASGGGAGLGRHCAARGTFWNIRSQNPIPLPPKSFSPVLINLVGVHTDQSPRMDADGFWFETIAPDGLVPQNIHQAQLKRRLALE
jgi:hypothetical protein